MRRMNNITAAQRQASALKMREDGVEYEDIATALGYASRSGAFKAVESALKRTIRTPADSYRIVELRRIEALWRVWYPQALSGTLGAFDRCLKLMERRTKLLGLDMPTQYQWVTEEDIEKAARERGLDPDEVLAEADLIMKGLV